MPYSEFNYVSVVLKPPSPNLINNNLAVGRDRLAYAHNEAASTVTHGGRAAEVTASKIETKDIAYTLGICSCYSLDGSFLVLTSQIGLQVWNSTGQLMCLNYEAPPLAKPMTANQPSPWHLTCAAGVHVKDSEALIVAASSSGDLFLFASSAASGSIKFIGSHSSGSGNITAMSSLTDSSRGATSSDVLVAGDDKGGIRAFQIKGPTGITEMAVREGDNKNGPVVGLAVRGDNVVAALSSGAVQILSLATLKLEVEVTLHSRMLTAMDIHPSKDMIATVSEDSTINVLPIPSQGNMQVQPLLSVCWPTAMLTGVAFCGDGANDVAVLGYDHEEIRIFKP